MQTTILPTPVEPALMPEPQTRGYFMNLMRTQTPARLELEVRRVAAAGFNLLIYPVYNNGWTMFPSQTMKEKRLDAISPLFNKWDPLARVVEIANDAGMEVWGFARPHNFHPRYSLVEHRLLKKYPQWRVRGHPTWRGAQVRRHELRHACPINHDYRRFLADLLAEVTHRYGVGGLMLNYTGLGLRGGSLDNWPYCFCTHCARRYRETFEGADLAADAVGENLPRVRRWQYEQAHDHLSYLRQRLTRTRRMLRLVAHATPEWRFRELRGELIENDAILMDWPRLLHSGMIEELVVDHDGETCSDHYSTRVAADYAYLGDRVLFVPMLSINNLNQLGKAIDVQNRLPIPGFIAEFQSSFTDEDVAQIRERYFPDVAMLPESNPVTTAVYLLDRIRQGHKDHTILCDMLNDILRLLARQIPIPDNFNLLEVIEENLLGLEQFIRRGQLSHLTLSEATMCDLGLARRFVRLACLDVRS